MPKDKNQKPFKMPLKPNGKPYHLAGPPHMSPATNGGICGILALGLLAIPVGVIWALAEAVRAVV